jgi:hypothetical protein
MFTQDTVNSLFNTMCDAHEQHGRDSSEYRAARDAYRKARVAYTPIVIARERDLECAG